jgi:outer membrane protein assembly factor BamB
MHKSSYLFKVLVIFFTMLAAGLILLSEVAAVFAAQEKISDYDQIVNLARKLSQDQPPTRWQTVITTEAADFISFLDNERVLIGTVEWGGYLGLPKHGDIKLFNAVTGKEIWTAGREKLANGHYALLTTKPLIVIVGREDEATRFQSYDPDRGSKKWGHRVKAPDQFIVTDSMDRIITLSTEGKNRLIEALDINTGKIVWKKTLPADLFSEKVPDALFMGNGAVFVAGKKLIKLAESNGESLWSKDHPALTASDRVAHYSPDGILIYHSGSIALLSEEDGAVLWEDTPQNSQLLSALILNNKIYRILYSYGNPGKAASENTVQALDIKSGLEIWSKHIEGSVTSPLYLENDILVFTTDKALYGLQAGNSEQSFVTPFSENFASGSPSSAKTLKYPDIIRFQSEKLYVTREMSGIAACSFPSGTILWEQLILNQETRAYCADSFYTTLTKAFPVSAEKVASKTVPALSSSSRSNEPNTFMRSAQSRYEYEKQRTDSVLHDRYATKLDRQSAR